MYKTAYLILACAMLSLCVHAQEPEKEPGKEAGGKPPQGQADEELIPQVEELLKQMGSEDWNTREKASEKMLALFNTKGGQRRLLAKYLIKRSKEVTDPEVKQRIERILETWYKPWEHWKELRTLEGHTGLVYEAVFSPDGKLLATTGFDGRVLLWNPETGERLKELKRVVSSDVVVEGVKINGVSASTGTLDSLAFSPDGKMLAAMGLGYPVWIWNVETGKCLHELNIDRVAMISPSSFAFSPDGKHIAVGSKSLKIWEVQTGKCIHTLREFEDHNSWCNGMFNAVSFTPDGEFLVPVPTSGEIRIWSVKKKQFVNTLKISGTSISCGALSPDGKLLAAGCKDKTVRLWDIRKKKPPAKLEGHENEVWIVEFSRDGKMLASAGKDKTVRLWKVPGGKCARLLKGHTENITCIEFGPKGKLLASASGDGTARVWSAGTGRCSQTLKDHTGGVRLVNFSPDGKLLLTADQATLRVRDTGKRKQLRTLDGHFCGVDCVTFSPDGGLLASGGSDALARLWDPRTGKCIHALKGHTKEVSDVAFSPDGTVVATGSRDKTVRLWEVKSGKCLHLLEGHVDSIYEVAFSPDGKYVASSAPNSDDTTRIWDVKTGKCLHVLKEGRGALYPIAFTSNGRLIAFKYSEAFSSYDPKTGECIGTTKVQKGEFFRPTFSTDGKFLSSVGDGHGGIPIWDAQTGKLVRELRHPYTAKEIYEVDSVKFSPDGKLLACECIRSDHERTKFEHVITIWNTQDGKRIRTVEHGKGFANSIAFSPDADMLAIATSSKGIIIWGVEAKQSTSADKPGK